MIKKILPILTVHISEKKVLKIILKQSLYGKAAQLITFLITITDATIT